MTEFLKKEFGRLVDKLTETDPSTTSYHILLQSIECLDSIGKTIDEIVAMTDPEDGGVNVLPGQIKLVEFTSANEAVVPFEAADFPAPAPAPKEEPKEETKTWSASEVRAAMVEAKKKGVDVKAILAKYNAANFNEIPANRYGEVMAELEAV